MTKLLNLISNLFQYTQMHAIKYKFTITVYYDQCHCFPPWLKKKNVSKLQPTRCTTIMYMCNVLNLLFSVNVKYDMT